MATTIERNGGSVDAILIYTHHLVRAGAVVVRTIGHTPSHLRCLFRHVVHPERTRVIWEGWDIRSHNLDGPSTIGSGPLTMCRRWCDRARGETRRPPGSEMGRCMVTLDPDSWGNLVGREFASEVEVEAERSPCLKREPATASELLIGSISKPRFNRPTLDTSLGKCASCLGIFGSTRQLYVSNFVSSHFENRGFLE